MLCLARNRHGHHCTATQRNYYYRLTDQGQDAEDLSDDEPLLGGDLEIDSIDILQLILEIERRFGIKLVDGEFDESAWQSIERWQQRSKPKSRPSNEFSGATPAMATSNGISPPGYCWWNATT